jgi:hypothetical protein
MTLHLVAYAINAVSPDRAEVVIAVAEKDHNGDWRETVEGQVVYPFWDVSLENLAHTDIGGLYYPTQVPAQWIEHLQSIPVTPRQKTSLIDLLGLNRPKVPSLRRI